MMLIFSLLNRKCFCSVLNVVSGMKGANGSWKKEWMVTPPALMAAIPVGATMTVRLGDSFFRLRRKVVFRFLLSGEEEMGAGILYYLPGTL